MMKYLLLILILISPALAQGPPNNSPQAYGVRSFFSAIPPLQYDKRAGVFSISTTTLGGGESPLAFKSPLHRMGNEVEFLFDTQNNWLAENSFWSHAIFYNLDGNSGLDALATTFNGSAIKANSYGAHSRAIQAGSAFADFSATTTPDTILMYEGLDVNGQWNYWVTAWGDLWTTGTVQGKFKATDGSLGKTEDVQIGAITLHFVNGLYVGKN